VTPDGGGPPAPTVRHRNRLALVVFWGSAAFLAPWIVLLAVTQKTGGTAYHVRFLGIGGAVLLIGASVVTAVHCRRRSSYVVPSATFTGTLAFITGWFAVVATTGRARSTADALCAVVLLPLVGLSVVLVRRCYVQRHARAGIPPWAPAAYLVGAALLVPFIGVVALSGHADVAAVHLRVVWTGLDVFELWFLVATGIHVYRGTPMVAVTAMCLATLLFSDAWFNILSTTGVAAVAAVVMAFGEVPVALYAAHTGLGEVRRWQGDDTADTVPVGLRRPGAPTP